MTSPDSGPDSGPERAGTRPPAEPPAGPLEWSLTDLARDILAGRWIIAFSIALALIGVLIFYTSMPSFYRLSVVIGPPLKQLEAISPQTATDKSDPWYSPAAFLQNSQRDARRDKFTRLEVILTGRAVAESLAENTDLREGLKLDKWHMGRKSNPAEPEVIDDYLDQALDIRKIGDTAMRRVIYHSPSPEFGQALLRFIISQADQHIKSRDRRDLSARIRYLRTALKNVANPEQKKAIAFLLTLQEQRLTLLETDQYYAAQIIDPPAESPRPVWPSLSVLVSFALFGGGLIGYLLFILWRGLRRPPENRTKSPKNLKNR